MAWAGSARGCLAWCVCLWDTRLVVLVLKAARLVLMIAPVPPCWALIDICMIAVIRLLAVVSSHWAPINWVQNNILMWYYERAQPLVLGLRGEMNMFWSWSQPNGAINTFIRMNKQRMIRFSFSFCFVLWRFYFMSYIQTRRWQDVSWEHLMKHSNCAI